MADIKGTELEQIVNINKQIKIEQYRAVCQKLPQIKDHISQQEYLSTMILMESRTFKYPGGHCCLIPVADMFNNNSNANIDQWAFEQ
jgi:hypothetical protein